MFICYIKHFLETLISATVSADENVQELAVELVQLGFISEVSSSALIWSHFKLIFVP